MNDLRTRIINHILWIKTMDEDESRDSLQRFNELLPWFKLNADIGAAMKAAA